MRSILHKFFLAPVVMAAAALATTSASAETTVKVPFGFTVDGQICSAGTYAVQHDSTGNYVTLINKRSSKVFMWVVGPGTPDPTDNRVSLKFDKAGGTHALRSIQVGSLITSRLDKKDLQSEDVASGVSEGR
jgi:hypothetical protein